MLPMIPAIIAMIAGAAITAHGQNQAAKKQQQAALMSQRKLMDARNDATATAMKRVEEFDPTARTQKQDEIAQALTADYQQAATGTPVTAQGVQVGATIPGTAATSDYLAATAREKAKSTESLRTLAQLMGRIGSAGQLRRDEAVAIGDTAGAIGRIQTGAENIAGIDQLRINAIRPSVGSQILGGALQAYGSGSLMGAGAGAASQAAPMGLSHWN